jgi:hypothetical protein
MAGVAWLQFYWQRGGVNHAHTRTGWLWWKLQAEFPCSLDSEMLWRVLTSSVLSQEPLWWIPFDRSKPTELGISNYIHGGKEHTQITERLQCGKGAVTEGLGRQLQMWRWGTATPSRDTSLRSLITTTASVGRLARLGGSLNISDPYRSPRPVRGIDLFFSSSSLTRPTATTINTACTVVRIATAEIYKHDALNVCCSWDYNKYLALISLHTAVEFYCSLPNSNKIMVLTLLFPTCDWRNFHSEGMTKDMTVSVRTENKPTKRCAGVEVHIDVF